MMLECNLKFVGQTLFLANATKSTCASTHDNDLEYIAMACGVPTWCSARKITCTPCLKNM